MSHPGSYSSFSIPGFTVYQGDEGSFASMPGLNVFSPNGFPLGNMASSGGTSRTSGRNRGHPSVTNNTVIINGQVWTHPNRTNFSYNENWPTRPHTTREDRRDRGEIVSVEEVPDPDEGSETISAQYSRSADDEMTMSRKGQGPPGQQEGATSSKQTGSTKQSQGQTSQTTASTGQRPSRNEAANAQADGCLTFCCGSSSGK